VRTIFNVLGPLTNPAGARRQVMGVFARELVEPLAHVLKNLGAEHALVVAGGDGLDEITITGPSLVAEATPEGVKVREVTPASMDLEPASGDELTVDSPEASAKLIRAVLAGSPGPPRRIVQANAAAALLAGGKAGSLAEGVKLAAEAIDSGRAARTLERLVAIAAG
jgi:anthranilate phosphoribosyltransferase